MAPTGRGRARASQNPGTPHPTDTKFDGTSDQAAMLCWPRPRPAQPPHWSNDSPRWRVLGGRGPITINDDLLSHGALIGHSPCTVPSGLSETQREVNHESTARPHRTRIDSHRFPKMPSELSS